MEKIDLNWAELPFKYTKTDCHLEYHFREGQWDDGKVVEDDRISLNIASTCLHYGQQCFEGLKVFEAKDGRALVFRADENARRMVRSAKKLLMQPFPEEKFIEAVERVVQLNKRYIPPHGSGASLYVRPLLLGTSGLVGVKPSTDYVFMIFCTPVGPYFKNGLKPIKLLVEEEFERAAAHGVGDVKAGGNYAAGLRGTAKAHSLGYDEVLYLDPSEKKYIDESGPANFFGITYGKYITPSSSSILGSITNKSLMDLARDMGIEVDRRPIHVEEIFNLKEAGCCGTAAVIAPVKSITFRDKTVTYCEDDEMGEVSKKLYDRLRQIQLGLYEDKFGWTKEVARG